MNMEDFINKIEGESSFDFKSQREALDKLKVTIEDIFFKHYRRHTIARKESKSFREDKDKVLDYARETFQDVLTYFNVTDVAQKENMTKLEVIKKMLEASKELGHMEDCDEPEENTETSVMKSISHGELIMQQIIFPILVEHWMDVLDCRLDIDISDEALKEAYKNFLKDEPI